MAQSGGLSTDIIKRGEWRGLRFSGLVTIGNSADVAPHELVEYYLEDPQTKVIGLYLEDIKDGRSFFDLLRSPKATKPVVILKGGRSRQGRLARGLTYRRARRRRASLGGAAEPACLSPWSQPSTNFSTRCWRCNS